MFGYYRTSADGFNLYVNATTTEYAAKLCDDYICGGYGDWFLPSYSELIRMYENLALNGLGNFQLTFLY